MLVLSVPLCLWSSGRCFYFIASADKLLGTHKGSPAVKQRKKNTQTEWVHKDNSTKQVSLLIEDFLLFALLSLI